MSSDLVYRYVNNENYIKKETKVQHFYNKVELNDNPIIVVANYK